MNTAGGELTKREKQMLLEVRQRRRYPVARFELHSSCSEELISTALDYVRIVEEDDSMELVKERGEAIRSLEEKGYIRVDFSSNVWVCGDHRILLQKFLICSFMPDGDGGSEPAGMRF